MDRMHWLELCYDALGVPRDLPAPNRRRMAERALLEQTGQPLDILGFGAAEAALDLVVRYGSAGELDDVMLRWELAEGLAAELGSSGELCDEGTRRATACARKLIDDIVRAISGTAARSPAGRD